MTDRELLELAAKAAGLNIKAERVDSDDAFMCFVVGRKGTREKVDWNPLTDDGDSRRLQVALAIDLRFGVSDLYGPYAHARTEVRRGDSIDFHEICLPMGLLPDANATARRVVLEVAAAIGKAMP